MVLTPTGDGTDCLMGRRCQQITGCSQLPRRLEALSPAIGIGPNSAAAPCRLTAPDFRYWRFAARPRADHRAATAAESGDHAPDRGVWGRLGALATDLKLSHQLSAEVTADRVNNRIMDRPPQQRSQPGTE